MQKVSPLLSPVSVLSVRLRCQTRALVRISMDIMGVRNGVMVGVGKRRMKKDNKFKLEIFIQVQSSFAQAVMICLALDY